MEKSLTRLVRLGVLLQLRDEVVELLLLLVPVLQRAPLEVGVIPLRPRLGVHSNPKTNSCELFLRDLFFELTLNSSSSVGETQ